MNDLSEDGQLLRMIQTPTAIPTTAKARTLLTRSFSTSAPSSVPNKIELSLTAATAAIGAWVIAQTAAV